MTDLKLDTLIKEGYDIANSGVRDWPTYDGGLLDRAKYVTSSEIGTCSRKIKFGKLYPSGRFIDWGYAERGNVIEEWVVRMMRHALPNEVELMIAGDDQVSLYHGVQSGTADGMLMVDADDGAYTIGIEIKSIDPRFSVKNLPKPAHVTQLQQNMDLMEKCTVWPCTHGLLIYVDASNYQKRHEFVVTPNKVLQGQLRERAETIMNAQTANELPAEGMFNGDCKYCAFTAQCSAAVDAKKAQSAALQDHERAMKDVFK